MGVPDQLIEIKLKLNISTVIEGKLSIDKKQLDISIIENQRMLAQNSISVGNTGVFYLDRIENRYKLIGFDRIKNVSVVERKANESPKNDTVKQKGINWRYNNLDTNLTDQQIASLLENPENIPGRLIIKSNNLKKRALTQIAKKYELDDAFVVFMISNKGPYPPPGGYVYWGVCGTINGEWYIWQPGYKDLRSGKELIDPQRYMK